MTGKSAHFAFSAQYKTVVRELVTPVDIYPESTTDPSLLRKPVTVTAVWDTGATGSVISPRLKGLLKLFSLGKTTVHGVNDSWEVDTVSVAIELPNNVKVTKVKVSVCDLNSPGIDMLIGMDIIGQGDLAVCNGGGSTLFSFAVPPFENKTNLVDKAEAVNKRRKR